MLQSHLFTIRHALAMGALLSLGGLSGCKFENNPQAEYMASDEYKRLNPVDVKPIDPDHADVKAAIDVTTGKPLDHAPDTPLEIAKVPTPAPVASAIVLDDPNGESTEGERQPGWTGVYDIYWKLNWIRRELLDGNVPKNLSEVVVRTRKHSKRIADEFPDRSVNEYLDLANAALEHLDAGLEHMDQRNLLEEANIPWRSLPWSAGEAEMQHDLELRDLMPTQEKTKSRFGTVHADEENETSSPIVSSAHTRPYISSHQQQGVRIALNYARKYHTSPEQSARKEFESALKEIIRMRDLMHLRDVSPSVPGDDAVITRELRQELGGKVSRPDHYLPADQESTVDPLGPLRRDTSAPLIR